MTLAAAVPLAFIQEVKDFTMEWQSAFAILFMVLLLFVLWRTLKLMPQTKPQQLKPEANLEVGWSDIAGVDEAKAELQEVVEFLRDPKPFSRLGASVPKGVLDSVLKTAPAETAPATKDVPTGSLPAPAPSTAPADSGQKAGEVPK